MKTLLAILERAFVHSLFWGSLVVVLWSTDVIAYAASHHHG